MKKTETPKELTKRQMFAEAAAGRLKKSKSGTMQQENVKSKSPKQPVRVQKPNVRPTGRGR